MQDSCQRFLVLSAHLVVKLAQMGNIAGIEQRLNWDDGNVPSCLHVKLYRDSVSATQQLRNASPSLELLQLA